MFLLRSICQSCQVCEAVHLYNKDGVVIFNWRLDFFFFF